MALLNMKFNEETMYEQLSGALLPNEQIIAAVYVSYQEAGFLRSGGVQAGYLGLTDRDRLVGVRHSLVQSMPFSADLGLTKRLKVKKGLLGSRVIELDTGQEKLKIAATPKTGTGTDLPHQAEHFQTIVDVLEARQTL